MIYHFNTHPIPFSVPEHRPSVYSTWDVCITLHWSSHRKIKGSKKPRKLLKFGILNELGTEISNRVSWVLAHFWT